MVDLAWKGNAVWRKDAYKNEADIDNAISQLRQLQDKYGRQLYSYNINAMDSYTYIYICSFPWVMFKW